MWSGTLAAVVFVSYSIAIGTSLKLPENDNDYYSIPPLMPDDDDVTDRTASKKIVAQKLKMKFKIRLIFLTKYYFFFLKMRKRHHTMGRAGQSAQTQLNQQVDKE